MRPILGALLIAPLLGACDYKITGPDHCSDEGAGELHVVVRPAPGFLGLGAMLFVGDTMPLLADVRPVLGYSVDIWGSGGCAPDYGDSVPATIEWSSADPRIATVSSTGVVRGVADGTVRITARARERGLESWLDVAVWVRAGG
jgi:hypothetical protein